jgi:hypothetical protein
MASEQDEFTLVLLSLVFLRAGTLHIVVVPRLLLHHAQAWGEEGIHDCEPTWLEMFDGSNILRCPKPEVKMEEEEVDDS